MFDELTYDEVTTDSVCAVCGDGLAEWEERVCLMCAVASDDWDYSEDEEDED